MTIPFTSKWIYSRCLEYCKKVNTKNYSYQEVRCDLQKICKFLFIKLPLTNIIVLKNFYSKNSLIVSIRCLFSCTHIIFIKHKNSFKHYIITKKNFNVFEEMKDVTRRI